MGTWIYRGTGIALSTVVALLGAAVSVLLYYAGEDGLDLFYKDSTYMDEHRRIHKRMPTDDWYGILVLRAWTFGFIFIVPALIGFTASLVFKKILMVVYFVLAVLGLVAGSFLYTAAAYALVLYQVLVDKGVILNYDTWPWDSKYIRYEDFNQEYIDERCKTGRRATILLIAAAGVSLLAWVFLLSNLLYSACTCHYIGKQKAAARDRPRPLRQRPRPRRPPPTSSTTENSPANASVDTNGPSASVKDMLPPASYPKTSDGPPAMAVIVGDEDVKAEAVAVEELPFSQESRPSTSRVQDIIAVPPDDPEEEEEDRNTSEHGHGRIPLTTITNTSPENINIETQQVNTERM